MPQPVLLGWAGREPDPRRAAGVTHSPMLALSRSWSGGDADSGHLWWCAGSCATVSSTATSLL